VRKVKLSYFFLIPFLALLLTAIVLFGASNEISLADLFGQNRYGSQRGARLYESWRELQLAVDAFLEVVLNWKLIVFFVISLFATILTSLFAWKALQIYLTSASRPVSPTPHIANPAERRVSRSAPRPAPQRDASRSGLTIVLSGLASAARKICQSVSGVLLYTKASKSALAVMLRGLASASRKVCRPASGVLHYTKTWRSGLAGKLGGALSSLVIALGFLILATVYYEMNEMIQNQVSQRALTTAMNFSDAAASQSSGKGDLAVHTLLGKYSMAEEVAYIFLTDREGKIVAHNLPIFPAELQRLSPATAPFQRIVTFHGNQVLETGVPIDDGRLGVAYYGIWKAAIDQQVYHDLAPILGVIAVGIVLGIIISVFLARRITRPIIILKEGADRMSRGDFDQPVGVEPLDDFGGLATSLERLRSSLNAAFLRLNRE